MLACSQPSKSTEKGEGWGWLWFAQGISDFSYYDKVLRKLEGVSASSHLAAASILSH